MVAFASSADNVEIAIVEFEAEELAIANEDEELEVWMGDELEVPRLGLGVAVVWGWGGVEVVVGTILMATYVVLGCGCTFGG